MPTPNEQLCTTNETTKPIGLVLWFGACTCRGGADRLVVAGLEDRLELVVAVVPAAPANPRRGTSPTTKTKR